MTGIRVLYLVASVGFGLVFVLLTPPNAAPDEAAHQVKIVRVAQGNLFGSDPGFPLPDFDTWYGLFTNERMSSDVLKFSVRQVQDVERNTLECKTFNHPVNDTVSSYSPLLYIGPSIVYSFSCHFGLSFGVYLLTARTVNLVIATALIALGVGASRTAALPLAYIGLLPTVIYQISSISADAMLLGLSIACIGVTVGTVQREVDAKRGFWSLAVLSSLLSFSKPGYYWLSWLTWLCYPAFRRWGLSRVKFAAVFVLLPLLLQIGLLWVGRGSVPVVENVDPLTNLAFLKSHPWNLLIKLAKIEHTYPRGDRWNLLESFIGKLGWLSVPLPPLIYDLAIFGLLSSLFASPGPNLPKRLRIAFILLGVVSITVLSVPLYLYATPVNDEAIFGMQGRYFIPSIACIAVGLVAQCSARVLLINRLIAASIALCVLSVSIYCYVQIYYA